MPELPEVQTVATAIVSAKLSGTIQKVEVHWKRTIDRPDVESFSNALCGQRLVGVGRRGKFLILRWNGGWSLVVHLRMSGDLQVVPAAIPPGKHTRVQLIFTDRRELRFDDPRKFGRMYLVRDPAEVISHLGPEPLDSDFSPDLLQQRIAERRVAIKNLLLDQRVIAGLGNIYAVETLWEAKVHPLHRGDRLRAEQISRLAESARDVLQRAVADRGTDLGDGVWKEGGFTPQVYGREGQPCHRCGTALRRIVVAQRGTEFCPACQRRSVRGAS